MHTPARSRRFLPALLFAVLLFGLAPGAVTAGQGPSTAEARLHRLINAERSALGLVRLPWDRRLADIAQDRSDDMVANDYFAHPPSGVMAELLRKKNITWYRWGETLAWNTLSTATESADQVLEQWRNSEGHWNLLMSADFNYIAIGVARNSKGRYIWTALLLKGPDRTRPAASMNGTAQGLVASGKRAVTVKWTGNDVPLSVLTAGLKDFKLQRRVGSGTWQAVTSWTTATSRTFELTVGTTYRFRVRSRDHNGNLSRWSAAVTVKP